MFLYVDGNKKEYYDYTQIKFIRDKEIKITVPYNTRTEEDAITYVKNELYKLSNVNKKDINLIKNNNISCDHISQENFGMYDVYVYEEKLNSLLILREENRITSISINNNVNKFVLGNTNNYKFSATYSPNSAIYEPIIWTSTNPDVIKIDEEGNITLVNRGKTIIRVCSYNVCDEKEIVVYTEKENEFIYTVNSINNTIGNYDHNYIKDNYNLIMNHELNEIITDENITYTIKTFDNTTNKVLVEFNYKENNDIYTLLKEIEIKSFDNLNDFNQSDYDDILTDIKISLVDTLNKNIYDNDLLITKYVKEKAYLIYNYLFIDSNISFIDNIFNNNISTFLKYKYGNSYFYKYININFKEENEFLVEYEVRNEEELLNSLKKSLENKVDIDLISISKNLELSNNYNYNQDNMGIYDITYDNKVSSVIIYREENNLTDIKIIYPTNKFVYDLGNNIINLSTIITPNTAIYEKILWSSSDESIATITNGGVMSLLKSGKVIITATDETKTVIGTFEITIQDKENVNLIKTISRYSSEHYLLYDDGNLYLLENNKPIKIIKSNVKDIEYYDYYKFYYIDFNNNLYLNLDEDMYLENIIKFNEEYALSNNGEVYRLTNKEIILNNIKDIKYYYDTYFFLTNNNELYVVGNNIFGEKFNNNLDIYSPIILFENVKEYDTSYVLLNNKELYTFSEYILNPTLIDTEVDEVLYFNYISNLYSSNRFAVKKNTHIYYGDIYIKEKNLDISRYNLIDKDYKTILYYDTYYYLDSMNDLYSVSSGKIFENVKQIFVTSFDYTHNSYLHFITNDNKLYRYYNNSVYYIMDNIKEFQFSMLKTTDNDYLSWSNQTTSNNWTILDYPSKLVKEGYTYIPVKGVYIYEGTKTHITVGDKLDILGIVLPYNATNTNVIWSVDDESIATISSEGILTSLTTGTVTVTIKTVDGEYIATREIVIHPIPYAIEITPDYIDNVIPSSYPGEYTYKLTLYGNVIPVDAIDRDIIWSSSDETLAYISWYSERCEYYGKMYDSCASVYVGDKIGDVTLYAKTKDGKVISSITYKIIRTITDILFDEEIEIRLNDNNTYKLNPIVEPIDADIKYIKYKYYNNDVIDIDDNGLITAKKAGYTEIDVYFGNANLFDYIKTIYVRVIEILEPIFDKIIGIVDKVLNMIRNVEVNTTVNEFKNSIENNDDVLIKDKNNNIVTNGNLKTGYKLTYIDKNNEEIVYVLSVSGDVDGNGSINYLDYVNVYNHIYKSKHSESNKKLLTGEYLISADMYYDNKITYSDYVKIYNKIKELKGSK